MQYKTLTHNTGKAYCTNGCRKAEKKFCLKITQNYTTFTVENECVSKKLRLKTNISIRFPSEAYLNKCIQIKKFAEVLSFLRSSIYGDFDTWNKAGLLKLSPKSSTEQLMPRRVGAEHLVPGASVEHFFNTIQFYERYYLLFTDFFCWLLYGLYFY